jgi:DNA-binding response OmpR family regulator
MVQAASKEELNTKEITGIVKGVDFKEAKRVLVADYQPELRIIYRMNLEEVGYQIETANSGKVVLEKLDWFKPHLMILDNRIAAAYPLIPNVPVIMVGAKSTIKDMLLSKKIGAEKYLVKPVSKEDLLASVKSTLDVENISPLSSF